MADQNETYCFCCQREYNTQRNLSRHQKTKKHLLAKYRADPRVYYDLEAIEDASDLTTQELETILSRWREEDEYEYNRKERLGIDTCPDWF